MRLLVGTAIGLVSIFAAKCLPGYEWHCGWIGACIYGLAMDAWKGPR